MKKLPRRLWLTFAFALWLGACAPGQDAHKIEGDGDSVTILDAGDEAHARPFADKYCDALGKSAQFRRLSPHRHKRYVSANDVEFDCVSVK
ncbi:hypothetical protein [Reyranella sp.]|uniref:hypothetical protein n=1 Tax=Reyranella sp. TaxID=1929291 RepID=UPI0037850E7A